MVEQMFKQAKQHELLALLSHASDVESLEYMSDGQRRAHEALVAVLTSGTGPTLSSILSLAVIGEALVVGGKDGAMESLQMALVRSSRPRARR